MNLKWEALIVPVSDGDRTKTFYQEALGFRVDVDHRTAVYEQVLGFRHRGEASYRLVPLTPPGSEGSIQTGTGITRATPGSFQGLYLISSDLEATRAEFVERGVEVRSRSTSARKDRPLASILRGPTTTVSCRLATRMATAG